MLQNMRKRQALFFVSAIAVGGCAPTYTWVKPGASTSEFYRSKSYCQALAAGATPMDYSNQGSSTTYHSGTISDGSGGYGSYSGTSTTYNNNTGQAFANIGQSVKRQNLFNDCMRGEGWSPQASQESRSDSVTSRKSNWSEENASYQRASIYKDRVEMMSKPTLASETLMLIEQGQVVEVLKRTSGDWLRVRYSGKEGYIAERWIRPEY